MLGRGVLGGRGGLLGRVRFVEGEVVVYQWSNEDSTPFNATRTDIMYQIYRAAMMCCRA